MAADGGGRVHASQWPTLLPGPPPSSPHPPPSFLSVLSVVLAVLLTHTHTPLNFGSVTLSSVPRNVDLPFSKYFNVFKRAIL